MFKPIPILDNYPKSIKADIKKLNDKLLIYTNVEPIITDQSNIIYTDGACTGNGTSNAKGAFGIYIFKSDIGSLIKINKKTNTEQFTFNNITQNYLITNIRNEGYAILYTLVLFSYKYVYNMDINESNVIDILNNHIMPIEKLQQSDTESNDINSNPHQINIYTDSIFWINVVTKWLNSWKKNKCILDKKNADLILYMDYYLTLLKHNNVTVNFVHIKAHTGLSDTHSLGNEQADQLASTGINNTNYLFTIN